MNIWFPKYKKKISIKSKKIGRNPIKGASPQTSFIDSHWADIVKETSATMSMTKELSHTNLRKTPIVLEMMAGCGFQTMVFQEEWKPEIHIATDLDPACVSILGSNFKGVSCLERNALELPDTSIHFDFVNIDFNNFTFKKSGKWLPIFKWVNKNRPRWLAFTDFACYGFRLGNLKHYGVSTSWEYYTRILARFMDNFKYGLYGVFPFGNAAITLWRNGRYREFPKEYPLSEEETISKTKRI